MHVVWWLLVHCGFDGSESVDGDGEAGGRREKEGEWKREDEGDKWGWKRISYTIVHILGVYLWHTFVHVCSMQLHIVYICIYIYTAHIQSAHTCTLVGFPFPENALTKLFHVFVGLTECEATEQIATGTVSSWTHKCSQPTLWVETEIYWKASICILPVSIWYWNLAVSER